VPDGLPTEHAALTEPMAVGLHAVEKARMGERDAALVVGCGPVGLAVIAARRAQRVVALVASLRSKRVEPIVASDYSSMRRQLAKGLGAHVVVDPAERRPIDAYREVASLRPTAMFECVGVPGVIQSLMRDAPREARIVIVGVCMEPDPIRPMIGINKELSLQFVLGYTPDEFARTLRALAEGAIDVAPLVTGRVGIGGVPGAFEELGRPERHAKILVEPALDA
jgi:threonine dehydrogenase-like Zn-dependent dehydrogenase